MGFYDLTKPQRVELVSRIHRHIVEGLENNNPAQFICFFSDPDTYVRRSAYLAAGRIYNATPALQNRVLKLINDLMASVDERVRQTAVNAAGEIGMKDFAVVA